MSREYVVECFLKEHSILKDKIVYKFEPAGNDKICTISKEHGATLYLDKVRCAHLKYIHPEKVSCFFLITSVKLKGTCHETYHMIAKVDPVLLVKFGGVW